MATLDDGSLLAPTEWIAGVRYTQFAESARQACEAWVRDAAVHGEKFDLTLNLTQGTVRFLVPAKGDDE